MSVLFVIASKNFRDEEYKIPKEILMKNGVNIVTASTTTSLATGMLGFSIKPDILIKDAKESDFDSILVVGGSGTKELWENKELLKLVKDFYSKKKLIGAICLGPVVLAKAGILKGKRVTVFESGSKDLKENGAIYTAMSVEKDEIIITANGPSSANQFGQAFVKALLNKS